MDQRRVWLAVGLSLLLLLVYEQFIVRPYREHAVPPPEAGSPAAPEARAPQPLTMVNPAEAPAKPTGALAAPVADEAGARVSIRTDLFEAQLNLQGGRLEQCLLTHFRRTVDPSSPLLNLVEPGDVLPLTVQVGSGSDVGVRYTADRAELLVTGADEGEVVLSGTLPSGEPISKTLRFKGDSYLFDMHVAVAGGGVGLVLTPVASEGALGGNQPGYETAVVFADDKTTSKTPHDLKEESTTIENAVWAGFSAQYFVVLGLPSTTGKALLGATDGTPIVRIDEETVDGRASFHLFVGPKERGVLADAGHQLDRVLDFGYFWFIAIPLLQALKLLHKISGNYGVDIILLTACVKAVTIPLTQQSLRSMKAMQKLQPEMQRLRDRHKDDQVALQKEMMELYRRNKVNPLSGCVPMLLQIPIFVGLYNALMHSIELRHAPFMLWINDLAAPDRLMVAGIGIPVLVLLMGGSMILQQWLTPQQGDPTQQKIMLLMPVVFTFMFIGFPSGLVLYWLVNNVLSIAQQYWMLRQA
ncbi:MAG: membrane protein insertase YidC [bacterium]|nr:membrane protein insertase YidC [bacterium]